MFKQMSLEFEPTLLQTHTSRVKSNTTIIAKDSTLEISLGSFQNVDYTTMAMRQTIGLEACI